jgi:hypothetical protein
MANGLAEQLDNFIEVWKEVWDELHPAGTNSDIRQVTGLRLSWPSLQSRDAEHYRRTTVPSRNASDTVKVFSVTSPDWKFFSTAKDEHVFAGATTLNFSNRVDIHDD